MLFISSLLDKFQTDSRDRESKRLEKKTNPEIWHSYGKKSQLPTEF